MRPELPLLPLGPRSRPCGHAHAVELLHRIRVPCQASEPIHAEDLPKYWFTLSRAQQEITPCQEMHALVSYEIATISRRGLAMTLPTIRLASFGDAQAISAVVRRCLHEVSVKDYKSTLTAQQPRPGQ